jgi:hypothetical protein
MRRRGGLRSGGLRGGSSWRVISRAAMIVSLFGVFATATATPRATAAPRHIITCNLSAEKPVQFGAGAPIQYEAEVTCSSPPDILNTTVWLQEYIQQEGAWVNIAQKTSSRTGTDVVVGGSYACSAPIVSAAYRDHAHSDAFHGTWDSDDKYSASATLSC